MNVLAPLKKVYLNRLAERNELSSSEIAIIDFSEDRSLIDSEAVQAFFKEPFSLEISSPWDLLDRWRKLLIRQMLQKKKGEDCPEKKENDFLLKELNQKPFWSECQLIGVYRALNCLLAEISVKSPSIHQLESGATLLEAAGHWPWAEIPHARFHAELAVLWCALGVLLKQDCYINAAIAAAKWQLNTLAHDFSPFEGLLIQEEDASSTALLSWNYLLFSSVSHLPGLAYFKNVADKQLEYLDPILKDHLHEFPTEALFLETLVNPLSILIPIAAQNYQLPTAIFDPDTNLVGIRSDRFNVVCTHFGGGTGLGSVKAGDINILSYGPHHFPLADCRGFGIEGGAISNQKCVKPQLAIESAEFSLKKTVRIVSQPNEQLSHESFRKSSHSGIWAAIEQRFSQNKLKIDSQFYGFNTIDTLAFSFFVKAHFCSLENGFSLKPKSFDRYWDKSQTVYLKGAKGFLQIDLVGPEAELQIIPLSGGKNFWGADFLLAYSLKDPRRDYSWIIAGNV